jgi:hypothetical protein
MVTLPATSPMSSPSPSSPRPSPDPRPAAMALRTVSSVEDLIGRTPVLELRRFAAGEARAEIFAKLELLNPGGSVKDRLGVGLIDWAEREGLLKPGGRSSSPLPATPASVSPWSASSGATR